MDFEREELVECGEDYWITCPECGYDLEVKSVCEMPWNDGDEDEYTCSNCGKRFVVRPKFKFEGFYTYTDYYDD